VHNLVKFIGITGLVMSLILQLGGICRGAEIREIDAVRVDQVAGTDASEPMFAEPASGSAAAEVHTLTSAFAGYRFISVNRYPGNAAEYDYLHSSPILGGLADYLGKDTKCAVDGAFLNEKDFHGDLVYDYAGRYRINLRAESLYHNLDHDHLFPSNFTLGGNSYTPVDLNPADMYGVRIEQDLARFRYTFPFFPIHLNLGYWHMSRKGTTQQIFADHAFEGTSSTIYSATRPVDRQTHEGQFGFDTHLGLVDLIYEFRIREFGELTDIPRDTFVDRLSTRDMVQRYGGLLEHNENPDSRVTSHTIRLHTSLSGGVVGAASYTYARRENRSALSDFTGASQVSNTIQNVAGDFSYTPSHYFSLALKYRRQEIDRDGPSTLTSPSTIVVNPPVVVRSALNTRKDMLIASMLFRLTSLTTLKGEYRGEFLSRENIDSWVQPGKISTMGFPEHSETHTGSVVLLGRPFKGTKYRAEYRYSVSDKPEFAAGYSERHEGTAQVSYNTPNRWGVTANVRISRDNSDTTTITTLDLSSPSQVYTMPRNRMAANGIVSVWLVPIEQLTVTGSYSILRSSTDQAVLLASTTPGSNTLSNYTSQAQIYAVTALYRINERLDLSLALQQVRSAAEFAPQATAVVDTAGISDITRIDTVENSLSFRADYRFYGNYSCSLEYRYREYDNRSTVPGLFSGSVNSVMIQMAAKW
jgi:hypothetical protein